MIEIKMKAGVRTQRKRNGQMEEFVSTGDELLLTVESDTLVGADLSHKSLHCANLQGIDLQGANLSHTYSSMANFSRANLANADLTSANFMFAGLENSDLSGANLSNTVLHGARLFGADLRGAILDGARLRGAQYDEDTQWPENFDFRGKGAKLLSEVCLDWDV